MDSVINVPAVLRQSHYTLATTAMPTLLLPPEGRYEPHDYEKAFCPFSDDGQNIYTMRGINREQGCLVVVQPDQYVAHVFALHGTASLTAFFDACMLDVSVPLTPQHVRTDSRHTRHIAVYSGSACACFNWHKG